MFFFKRKFHFGMASVNKLFIPKRIIQTTDKKVLPSIRIKSTKLKIKLHKTFKQLLPACDLRVIYKISSRMKNCFNFKDKLKRKLRSLSKYNFKYNSCNDEYIGKTKRHYRTQISEHIRVSPLFRVSERLMYVQFMSCVYWGACST